MTIFKYTLIKGLRNPATLIFNCILPLILIFIRPLWVGEAIPFSGFGLMVMVIWGGSFFMAQGVLNDKEDGAITRILAAPVSMLRYLTENLLAYMVPLTVQIVLVSTIGLILYDWSLMLALALFICYTVFMISSVAMSFAWNCMFKSKQSSFSSFSAVVTFGSFVSGALIPIAFFPEGIVQHIGAILPAFWVVRGINSYLDVGFSSDYWISVIAMLLFTIAFLLFGGKRRMI